MTPRPLTRRSLFALLAAVSATLVALAPAPATASSPWADPATATIHPGVQTYTDGGQCTANFVFTDGTDIYIGQAAHCAGTGGSTDTNGCEAGSLPVGETQVEIDGASQPGTLAYSSWAAMQENDEQDTATCQYNDFALVRIHPDDHDLVNPSVPFWGGPVGLDSDGSVFGEKVLSYGNSSLRLGLTALSPKEGTSLGSQAGGWNHPVYTATPGVPGDSGSAFLDGDGEALGTLSTLAIAPLAGSNGVTDLDLALAYARANGFAGLELALGTVPFSGPLLP